MFMIAKRGMLPATALILYNYNGKVFASTRAVAGAANAFYRLLLSSEHIYQLMESSDFSRENFGDKKLDAVSGDIALKNVRFSYHNKGYRPFPAIKDMIQPLCALKALKDAPEDMSADDRSLVKESCDRLRELIDDAFPLAEC